MNLRQLGGVAVALVAAVAIGLAQAPQRPDDGSPEGMQTFSSAPYGKTFKPVIRGLRGVVGGGKYFAAQAGHRVLMQGGNAIDAGVATVFAEAITELDVFGFGGEVPVLVYIAKEKKVYTINGGGFAPKAVTIERYKKEGGIPADGILSATVPAVFDTLVVALDRFGTKSLADVLAPSIEFADGFPMYEHLAGLLQERAEATKKGFPTTARIYYPDGKVPKPGEIFRQPQLAATLRRLVEVEREHLPKGRSAALQAARDYFYRGPIAKEIGAFSQANGGLLTADDLAAYSAKVEEPVKTSYRGYEIYKAGFWTQGPFMLQVLNMLESYDLKAMGRNSPNYIHTLTEAMKLGFADRDAHYGDPDFARIPDRQLLSKEYATTRRTLIDPNRASLEQRPGDPVSMRPLLSSPSASMRPEGYAHHVPPDREPLGTTTANAADAEGNVFSATPSGAWLPPVVAGNTGIPLSQRLQQALLVPGHPNELKPHKRPRITLTPGIVMKDGRPLMAWSTAGGDSQDQGLLQVLLNVVEFDMNIQAAVEAPRFYTRHLVNTFYSKAFNPGVIEVENRISGDVRTELARRGHKVETKEGWAISTSPTVVRLLPNGVLEAAADVRQYRYALAW